MGRIIENGRVLVHFLFIATASLARVLCPIACNGCWPVYPVDCEGWLSVSAAALDFVSVADAEADVAVLAVVDADEDALELVVAATPSISTCILDPFPFLTIKTFSTGASEPAAAAAAASSKMGCRMRRLALMNQLLIWFMLSWVASANLIFSASLGYG